MTCAIDQRLGEQGHRLSSADVQFQAVIHHFNSLHWCQQGQQRARGFGITLQRQHQGVTVDDPGAGRQQASHGVELRLQCLQLSAIEPLQIVYAIGQGVRL